MLPLLSCCYTAIKEEKNSSIQNEPKVGRFNDFKYRLNQYEKLLTEGVPRDKALQVFSDISHIDDQGRLDVDIELSGYCSACRDTIWTYKGIFESSTQTGKLSYRLPPEAIRAISLIDCVRGIRRRSYGVTQ
jgi:hypothetical protein